MLKGMDTGIWCIWQQTDRQTDTSWDRDKNWQSDRNKLGKTQRDNTMRETEWAYHLNARGTVIYQNHSPVEVGTGTEHRTGFFLVISDRTLFLYQCTVLYLTVRHTESCWPILSIPDDNKCALVVDNDVQGCAIWIKKMGGWFVECKAGGPHLTKAFNTALRLGLWNILPWFGIPPKMVKNIQRLSRWHKWKTSQRQWRWWVPRHLWSQASIHSCSLEPFQLPFLRDSSLYL